MLLKHIVHQGPMISTVLKMVLSVIMGPLRRPRPIPQQLPESPVEKTLPPPPDGLINDFVRTMGGDPDTYRDCVPAHLFPQWCFPIVGSCIINLPYSMAKMLNAGCRMEINAPIPRGMPLQVRAFIESIDDDGRRAVVKVRVVTGTETQPDALVCLVSALFQIRRSKGNSGKEKPCVPETAQEIARLALSKRSGLDFALLTGDFNPVHWVGVYARISGFRSVILHGLGTFAHTVETLNRTVLNGQPDQLKMLELRFTRPLLLPGTPAVYCCEDGDIYVGDAPGKAPYAMGRCTVIKENENE